MKLNPNLLIWSVLLLGILIGCGTSKNGAPAMEDKTQQIYVDDATCGQTISAGDDLEVTVSGNLPSPAYTFDRFDVKVKDGVIEITPVADYHPDKLVAQVLVPFEEVCRVENLKPGTYDLKINSRAGPLLKKGHVRVQKN